MVSGNERAMNALMEQTARDISTQQLRSDAAINLHLQSGYLDSGNQFSGVRVQQL